MNFTLIKGLKFNNIISEKSKKNLFLPINQSELKLHYLVKGGQDQSLKSFYQFMISYIHTQNLLLEARQALEIFHAYSHAITCKDHLGCRGQVAL